MEVNQPTQTMLTNIENSTTTSIKKPKKKKKFSYKKFIKQSMKQSDAVTKKKHFKKKIEKSLGGGSFQKIQRI